MSKRDKAIKWWNGLSDSSKRFYDWMTFSHEEWEDPTVTEPDIVKMYEIHV